MSSKLFVGQNFCHLRKNSSLLSDIVLSNNVTNIPLSISSDWLIDSDKEKASPSSAGLNSSVGEVLLMHILIFSIKGFWWIRAFPDASGDLSLDVDGRCFNAGFSVVVVAVVVVVAAAVVSTVISRVSAATEPKPMPFPLGELPNPSDGREWSDPKIEPPKEKWKKMN